MRNQSHLKWTLEPLSHNDFLRIMYRSLGKFTVGYFRVKIVHGKMFSSLGVSDENFLKQSILRLKCLFHCSQT